MCEYCDFREPDRFGVSIDGKGVDALTMTIHEGGTVHLHGYCDYSRVEDRYQFNYCPMCGRKLSGDAEGENKPHYKPEETYMILSDCGGDCIVASWNDVLKCVNEEIAEAGDANVSVYQRVAQAYAVCTAAWHD